MKDVLKEYREYLGEIDQIVTEVLQMSKNNFVNRSSQRLVTEMSHFRSDDLVFNEYNAKDIMNKNFNYGITRFISNIRNINNDYLHRMDKHDELDEEVFAIISSHYDDINFEIKRLEASSSFDDVSMRSSTDILDDTKHRNYTNKLFDSNYYDIKNTIKKVVEDNFKREINYASDEIMHSINRVFENFKDDLYKSKKNEQSEQLDTSVFGGGKKLVKALPNMISSEEDKEVIESLPIDGIFK